ncbi:tripartite motif-containing protein 43-like [Dipodomys spectabilis]|uniref:tripartite motif-containing protein 43-like n=1 Tax=Dipodomys spectabilis TaxID=105255 RepID=UPI001C536ECD|nr:tripartite motif-containing protein 43-like [Dipodomys spectabilis]
MDPDTAQAFQKEVSCAICINTFIEPVTLECGHSFCRPCLCLCWEETQTPARCPGCRGPCQQRNLKTNVVLKSLVAIARRASLRRFLSSEEYMCGTHGETKQMFCEVDRALLCRSCSQSQEHRAHKHRPIERAAEEQREVISKQMHAVWEKTQENQHNLQEKRRLINQWICYVNLYRDNTKDVFRMLQLGVQEEERQHSQLLINEGRTMLLQLRERETQMLQKKHQLRIMYQELMETYQKPGVELLQDVELTLESCESVLFFLPLPLRPELSAPPIPGLIERLRQHWVEIAFNEAVGNQDHGSSVIHNHGVLNSEDSPHFTAFGCQVFISGKHYWEISVDDCSTWALGVVRDSVIGSNLSESEDVFLLLFVKENTLYTLFTTFPLLSHYVEKPLGQVGVFLDFDHGSVSFWNVAKSALIWRYPTGSLRFPVRPLFSRGIPVS